MFCVLFILPWLGTIRLQGCTSNLLRLFSSAFERPNLAFEIHEPAEKVGLLGPNQN